MHFEPVIGVYLKAKLVTNNALILAWFGPEQKIHHAYRKNTWSIPFKAMCLFYKESY